MPDVYRADQFNRELKKFEAKGELPNLMIMLLPNDHTAGTRPGHAHARGAVADNDLALGQIVEAISHSKFWPETCHLRRAGRSAERLRPHRRASHGGDGRSAPTRRRDAVDSTNYNQTSMVRTMELILGLPPMNQFDASATPMASCFTDDAEPDAVRRGENNIPLDQMNPPAGRRSATRGSCTGPRSRSSCRWTTSTKPTRTRSTASCGTARAAATTPIPPGPCCREDEDEEERRGRGASAGRRAAIEWRMRRPRRRITDALAGSDFCHGMQGRRSMTKTRSVGILVFEDVEVLDFCGPFEVFSVAGRQIAPGSFSVFTVANVPGAMLARNGLSVNPEYTLADAPPIDLLLIPGGQGTRPLMHDAPLIEWIGQRAAAAELVLSVCTGALLLAKAGLLDGLAATTHHGALELLRSRARTPTVRDDVRYVDNGRVITSAGVAAGIDMSFHVVDKPARPRNGHRHRAIHRISLAAGLSRRSAYRPRFQFRLLPSAIHSTAVANRLVRVSSRLASLIHTTYSLRRPGVRFSNVAAAFLFFLRAACKSAGTVSLTPFLGVDTQGDLMPVSSSLAAVATYRFRSRLARQIGPARDTAERAQCVGAHAVLLERSAQRLMKQQERASAL